MKIYINGFEWWVDTISNTLLEHKDSTAGTNIYSNHVTKNELAQIQNQIKYNR